MIKFVYFDLGGVMILDFSKTDKWKISKKEMGITPKIEKKFDKIWRNFQKEVCKGRDVEDLKQAEMFKWRTYLYDPANPKRSSKELINYYNQLI